MGLINQDNRTKQDLTHTRTPEDVMRRLAKNVQITTDEVKGLTVEVSKKVGNDEIISRINQSAEAVTIDASKININGTISANGNFKVDTDGTMECNQAKMKNATLEDDSSIMSLRSGSVEVKFKEGAISQYRARVSPYGFTVGRPTESGGIIIPNSYIYLEEEDYGDTSDRYALLMLSSIVNGVKQADKIKMYGRDGNITCVSLTQTSSADKKKNFEKLENALDIVKDVDIYKYNMKEEKDTDKKHIGFVIGDNYKYREEITSQTNKEAEIYSMISVLWKAVQEQQKEIEELKKVIK